MLPLNSKLLFTWSNSYYTARFLSEKCMAKE